ncbi:MAG: hypothetical protein ABEH38_02315 [Flavobacteriales bacterium]
MRTRELPYPSDDRIESLRSELKSLESRIDFLLRLSMDERCALPKLDEDRELFTRRALEVGKEHPELLPGHIQVELLEQGLEFRKKVLELFEMSNEITERLDDTAVASGSEAYVTALSIYQALTVRVERDPSLEGELQHLRRLFEPWEQVIR